MRVIPVLWILLVAGCTSADAYYGGTDVWHPTGANAANIAAMAADPRDLVRGHGDGRVDAHQAVGAVNRVSQDGAKPLSGASGGASGGAGGATAGVQN